jgi:hypothetical protein
MDDALDAHARDELGISAALPARTDSSSSVFSRELCLLEGPLPLWRLLLAPQVPGNFLLNDACLVLSCGRVMPTPGDRRRLSTRLRSQISKYSKST